MTNILQMGWFDHQLDKPSGFAAEWPSIRDAAVQRCAAQTWPAVHGDHPLVLLEFIGGGYGAMVAAAWVMRKVGKGFFLKPTIKDPLCCIIYLMGWLGVSITTLSFSFDHCQFLSFFHVHRDFDVRA